MADLEKEKKKPIFDRLVDFAFKNKWLLILFVIFIIGIFLRYFAAISVEPNADEMVHGPHAIGIIKAGVIGRVWQAILWSYLTDLSVSLISTTLFGIRFLSFLFGSLTIILVYILGKEIFDNRIALIASFLIAISSFHVIYTLIEMDLATIFFILLAAIFFIRKLKKDGSFSMISAVFIGVASLIKTLALFFIPAFIIYYWIYNKIDLKQILSKKYLFPVIKFLLIIILLFSPIIIHNILLYQNKNLVDAYVSQYFDIGNSREIYSGIQGISQGFKLTELFKGIVEILGFYIQIDPVNLVLGVLALSFFLIKKKKFTGFFILFQIIPFILLTITNRLSTHYAIFPPVFALYGAAFIDFSIKNYFSKISYKKALAIVLLLITIINIFYMAPYLGSKTALKEMRDYTIKDIDKNAIVVADSRIYRGRIMWLFIDRHYIESALFSQVIALDRDIGGQKSAYDLYFIECATDDCGWGTIKDQPEFNQSSEEIVSFFQNISSKEKTIYGGGSPLVNKNLPYFNVYKTKVSLSPAVVNQIDSTHSFFYYPANYQPKSEILDYYSPNGFFQILSFNLAKIIIWIALIISVFSILLVFWLVYKESNL